MGKWTITDPDGRTVDLTAGDIIRIRVALMARRTHYAMKSDNFRTKELRKSYTNTLSKLLFRG